MSNWVTLIGDAWDGDADVCVWETVEEAKGYLTSRYRRFADDECESCRLDAGNQDFDLQSWTGEENWDGEVDGMVYRILKVAKTTSQRPGIIPPMAPGVHAKTS